MDRSNKEVVGLDLGQDALHIYKRLLGAVNMHSEEASFGIRCLRKWLGSVNPATRCGQAKEADRKHGRAEGPPLSG